MSFYKIRPRAGTASQWTTANPILAEREIGFEFPAGGIGTGEVKAKMGDGVSHWNDLAYAILPMPTIENEESTSTDKSPSSAYVKGKFDSIQSDLTTIRQNMAVKMKAVQRTVSLPNGSTTMSETQISFANDLPSGAQLVGINITFGDFHLPYSMNGNTVGTWVSRLRSQSIVVNNRAGAYSNYTMTALLFYVEGVV